jgi:hypothetical protein
MPRRMACCEGAGVVMAKRLTGEEKPDDRRWTAMGTAGDRAVGLAHSARRPSHQGRARLQRAAGALEHQVHLAAGLGAQVGKAPVQLPIGQPSFLYGCGLVVGRSASGTPHQR